MWYLYWYRLMPATADQSNGWGYWQYIGSQTFRSPYSLAC
mgnify:CR=1 FL=1